MRKLISITLCCLCLLSLVACSAKSEMSDGIMNNVGGVFAPEAAPDKGMGSLDYSDTMQDDAMQEYPSDNEQESVDDYLQSQKLIYTCDIRMQSKTFETTMQEIKKLIDEYNGFVESEKLSDDSHRWYYSDYEKNGATLYATLTIRIPADNYRDFLNAINGQGKVLSKYENVQNITKQYNEVESKIVMLEKEEQMLLEMMDKCGTISEMITVEERLSRVQQQLASLNNTLNGMDSSVAFSTIKLSLEEVVEYQPDPIENPNFIERVVDAIKDSAESFAETIEDVFIFVIYIAPYLVVGVIIFIIVRLRIKSKKKVKPSTINAMPQNVTDKSTIKEEDFKEGQRPTT